MKNANMPISPTYELNGQNVLEDTSYGLTKREHIAAMAMSAYLNGVLANSHPDYNLPNPSPEDTAKEAVYYADALLEELEKTNEPD